MVTKPVSPARLARLMGATALACLMVTGIVTASHAQSPEELAASRFNADSQMLLEADTLVYDNDRQTVTAVGGVQIDYDGNRLVAQRVAYDRSTGRLVASGAVEVIDKTGNKISSSEIDVTDDFRDGFVNRLRLETPDKTYFGAESAERRDGAITTFNTGVYTACEPCEKTPDKSPVWRVKAKKIIWNGQTKTVRFENARFEMFGYPLAYLPYFDIADPTVKRKSGFLLPQISYKNDLGIGVGVPYYLALDPTYDLTITPRGYSSQGFMAEAEFRQRFDNGQYSIKVAAINQASPGKFDYDSVDSHEKFRGMVATKGNFNLNSRWNVGWDVMAQTDKNFAYSYGISDYDTYVQQSEIYLTGLNDRNFFDLRTYSFQVQESILDSSPNSISERQPIVLPVMDYSVTPDTPVFGGELNINMNVTALTRDRLDAFEYSDFDGVVPPIYGDNIRGVDGRTARMTAQAEWRRTFITPGGLALTPLLQLRGDTIYANYNGNTIDVLNNQMPNIDIDVRSQYWRYMATAGLEARWPILFSMANSSHVVEPMAQILARPDEQFAQRLGIPNEDAQSMVFDATTLFETDKFSGYDRIEGGTRANLGIRYSGSFSNGWTTNAIVGQSFQIAGLNSFAGVDMVSAGAYSGLEHDRSDYVAQVGVGSPNGFAGSVGGRFDEKTLNAKRAELKVGYNTDRLSASAKYAFIEKQALYGFVRDRHEVTVGARAKVNDYWSVFGSAIYDFQSEVLVRDSIGFAYDDECFTFALALNESRDINTRELSRGVGFNLSFRTIGDFGSVDRGNIF